MSVRPERVAMVIGLVTAAGVLIAGLQGCGTPFSPANPTSTGNTTVATPVPPNLPPAQATPTPGPNPPSVYVRTNPDPPDGKAPLDVNFNACKSTDPDGD